MGGSWIPQGLFALEPWWRNFFDNMTTAQFDHRWLAKTTLLLVVVFWARARKAQLPPLAVTASQLLLGLAVLQVMLGITTLLMRVPVWLGASHQAVAMLLFTAALLQVHSLRKGRKST
jgi:cytochrome c oxidase assembly protein subunit 15